MFEQSWIDYQISSKLANFEHCFLSSCIQCCQQLYELLASLMSCRLVPIIIFLAKKFASWTSTTCSSHLQIFDEWAHNMWTSVHGKLQKKNDWKRRKLFQEWNTDKGWIWWLFISSKANLHTWNNWLCGKILVVNLVKTTC